METGSSMEEEDQERRHISSQPEFAEIYIFLQIFGPLMNLSKINLKDLEDFFINADCIATEVVTVQWHLLRCTGRNGGKAEWQHMAVKFAAKVGLLSTAVPYQDISVLTRMKLFQRLCEEQFDCNVNLRNNLSWDVPFFRHTKPIGVDRDGRRYWLLQDSVFDLHLYSDHGYADPPKPKHSDMWKLLARSLSDLAKYISYLESRSIQTTKSTNSATPTPTCALGSAGPGLKVAAKSGICSRSVHNIRRQQQRPSQTRGKKVTSSTPGHKVIGCLKCLKDVDYKKMLLCDTCDRECHTYCHYPVLWTVPKGEWLCPICKEQQLLKELHQIHLGLSQAKAQHEVSMERKQRQVARLQKSGVLTQNILDDGEEKGRSRRQNRKKINYAELNDVYLPPLSPRELVGRRKRTSSELASTRRSMYSYIQEDYLAPRVRTFSRRFRGPSPKLEAVVEEEVKLLDEGKRVASKDEGNKWEEDEGGEGKWEEEVKEGMDERKCVSLTGPTCSHSAVALDAGVKETSILGKRSHDLLCHEDTYDDHISISSASSSRESVVGHSFNKAVANGSSTFATRKQLQMFGNLVSKDMKRSADIRSVTKDKNSKLTEVCTMEEDLCMLQPHHHSSHDALCHERAHSKGFTPASFSPMEESSPQENVEFEKTRDGSLDCVGQHTK